jgi:hypothetical protein
MSEGAGTVADEPMSTSAPMTSRRGEFDDGSHGGDTVGSGMHQATSVQQGVQPGFAPDSILQIPNILKSMNGMSDSTYSKSLPMQSMMRNSTGYGGPAAAGGGNGTMNV